MVAATSSAAVLFCVALGACLPQAGAKLQRSRLRLGADARRTARWQYVAKFGYGIGEGSYEARLKEVVPGSVVPGSRFELEVFMDEDWERVESVTEVCRKKAQARRIREIAVGYRAGAWGPVARGSIRQSVRPHVWYFAVSDCSGAVQNGTHALDLDIEFRQESGSQFSIEAQWAPSANAIALLGCGAFLFSFFRKGLSFLEFTGSLHPVIWALGAVLMLQFVGQCLHTGHLALYRSNGVGSKAADVLSEVLFTLCQVTQTCLLVSIAMGYTLQQGAELDLLLPVCGLLALVHIALVVLGKAQSEAAHRFSDHDGSTGWVFLGLRLALYAWFLLAASRTSRQGGMRLRAFIARFRAAASLYFLAYPGTFLAMQLIAPYFREPVMETGLTIAQVASNVWLTSLFLDRGTYFHASELSASPLPSSSVPSFFKNE